MHRQLMALLLLPAPALAQTIRGTILDAATGAPVPAANVTFIDRAGRAGFSSVLGADGHFQLAVRAATVIRLEFGRLGYVPVVSRPLVLEHGQVVDLEVRLSVSAVPMDPITVLAPRPVDARVADFYERAVANRRLGQGRIWTRPELEKIAPVTVSHLLRTVGDRASCTRREVYIDGAPVSMRPATGFVADLARASSLQPPSAQPDTLAVADRPAAVSALLPAAPGAEPQLNAVVDWLVSPEDVEGIEIYRDAEIPMQFNPDGELCQVTLIWRRPYAVHNAGDPSATARGAFLVAVVAALTTFLLSLVH